MKEIFMVILCLSLLLSPSVYANDEIQTSIFKDNVVYINGYSIPSVQLQNGYAYVWVDDLAYYGFDIKDEIIRDDTNGYYKIYTVTRNQYKQFNPKTVSISETLTITPTKNVVYLDSNTPANVYITKQNCTLLQCDELAKYGEFNWDIENKRIDISVGEMGTRLPESMTFSDILGLNSKEDIKYATIEYIQELNNTVADIGKEDIEKLLNTIWDFGYNRETGLYSEPQVGTAFINVWTDEKDFYRSNNRIKYTIYPDKILYNGYGRKISNSGIYSTGNAIWYTAKGNGANAIYNTFYELFDKYKDKTRTKDNYDGEALFWVGKNELPLQGASEWAKEELNEAASYDLLPYEFSYDYQNYISRQNFCTLAYQLLKTIKGQTGVLELADKHIDEIYYSDFENNDIPYDIKVLSTIGIVNGVGGNQFQPLGNLTREQAAKMLYEMAKTLGYDTTTPETDLKGVSDWAKEGVNFVIDRGIMIGTDNGFEPQGTYTREQAIITMVRFYENLK